MYFLTVLRLPSSNYEYIYLKHGCVNLIFNSSWFRFNSVKHFITSDWYNSFVNTIANHTVRFSWSSLSIREKTEMISFPCIVKDIGSDFLIDLFLISIFGASGDKHSILFFLKLIKRPKWEIKCESPLLFAVIRLKDCWWVLHIYYTWTS